MIASINASNMAVVHCTGDVCIVCLLHDAIITRSNIQGTGNDPLVAIVTETSLLVLNMMVPFKKKNHTGRS